MKNLFLIISLLISFVNINAQTLANDSLILDYKASREFEIGGISISGAKHLDENILLTLSGLSVGDRISIPGENIANAIKSLWKQGLFSNVQIYQVKTLGDVIFLEILVKERPRLSNFSFRGVKKVEADELQEKVKLIRGKVVTENLKLNTQRSIKDYYTEKGFLNADIRMTERIDTAVANSVFLIINIDRGKKVRIEDISFSGNESVAAGKLRSLMKNTKEKTKVDFSKQISAKRFFKEYIRPSTLGNLSPSRMYHKFSDNVSVRIFNSSKFLKNKYEEDKRAVIAYYNSKGYRDAKIAEDNVFINENNNVNVNIKIHEGDLYRFGNITFEGNTKYPDSVLQQILGIKPGETYDLSLLETRLYMNPNGTDVSSLYMDNGYLFFQITPVEVKVENSTIDIEVQVYEGAQAVINKIIITGNTKTNEHVIRRELRTIPGNRFSRADIIRSHREIANLGYFDQEKIEINPIPNPQEGTVDIEYRLEEKPSDQLEFNVGWGGQNYGVYGTVGVSFNNFSIKNAFKKNAWFLTGGSDPLPTGDGQRLSFRVQANGRSYRSLNFSFVEPWLGGKKPNALSLSAYQTLISRNFLNTKTSDESLLITGGSIGYGVRLKKPDDFFVLQSSLNFQNFKINNYPQFDFPADSGQSNNFSIKEVLSRSSIDQPIYPRSGSNLSFSVQVTPPYSLFRTAEQNASLPLLEKFKLVEYHKWRFNADWYQPIVGNLVLKTSAKMGYLGYYNKSIGIPPFERFRLGGDGLSNQYTLYGIDIISMRGYEVEQIDRDPKSDEGKPIFNKFNIELRYPFSLNPSATIYGLVFAEGGNVWSNFRSYNPYDLKRSAGVGLRAHLPMFGTVGFDYGIGFDKIPGSSNGDDGFFNYLSRFGKVSVILGFEPE